MTTTQEEATTAAQGAANPAEVTDSRELIGQLAFGSMAAQTLRTAVRLRVLELISRAPRQACDVAADVGADPQSMTRLLRALAGLGLLREHTAGSFSATTAGTLLHPDHPESLASFVRTFTDPGVVRAWEDLETSVRTGEIAFDHVFGTDFFTHLAQHPQLSADFNAAMSGATAETAAALPHAYDFGSFATVTDVGGGDGTLLSAVLAAHPHLSGVVLDTDEGLSEASTTLERHGVEGRCALRVGDFFQSVPGGSELYLVKSVLHDWADEQAVTILRHIHEALPPGGRVLIVEPVLPEVVDASPGTHAADGGATYLSDLNMLVNVGGRERTRADFEELCHQAGLALTSLTPLAEAAPFFLIEAVAKGS